MISGVSVRPLRKIPDERGTVMRMLRCDDPHFDRFGEIYFSTAYPGVVKAWHLHARMTLNYAVVAGMIKLVLFDDRIESASRGEVQELYVGQDNYVLVTIPPLIWNGFTPVGGQLAIVANCATEPHDPDEIQRVDPMNCPIPYSWAARHG